MHKETVTVYGVSPYELEQVALDKARRAYTWGENAKLAVEAGYSFHEIARVRSSGGIGTEIVYQARVTVFEKMTWSVKFTAADGFTSLVPGITAPDVLDALSQAWKSKIIADAYITSVTVEQDPDEVKRTRRQPPFKEPAGPRTGTGRYHVTFRGSKPSAVKAVTKYAASQVEAVENAIMDVGEWLRDNELYSIQVIRNGD